VSRRLLIGIAAQRPGQSFRLALIGYSLSAKVVQVSNHDEVKKLVQKHRAAGVVWEGGDDSFDELSPG
jgi:hypothetical protein